MPKHLVLPCVPDFPPQPSHHWGHRTSLNDLLQYICDSSSSLRVEEQSTRMILAFFSHQISACHIHQIFQWDLTSPFADWWPTRLAAMEDFSWWSNDLTPLPWSFSSQSHRNCFARDPDSSQIWNNDPILLSCNGFKPMVQLYLVALSTKNQSIFESTNGNTVPKDIIHVNDEILFSLKLINCLSPWEFCGLWHTIQGILGIPHYWEVFRPSMPQ